MTVQGIDVASYQPATFSTTGLGLVLAKATEGTGYVNPKHAAQVAHARAEGCVVGHYHFARPGSMTQQLEYFLAHAAVQAGDLIGFDWEDAGVTGADKDGWIKAAQSAAAAHRVLLYCNRDFWLHRDTTSFCGDGLWIADPDAPAGHPRVEHPWTIHQYSEAGGTDRNVANFADLAALKTWAAKGTPPPPPAPAKPKVSLKRLLAAAKADPKAKQGHTTHPADVKPVEAALHKLGYLPAKYDADGSFGSLSVAAYAKWQKAYSAKHHLGWSGADVNGFPGLTSLKALASTTGLFTVTD